MGKVRRQRNKLHLTRNHVVSQSSESSSVGTSNNLTTQSVSDKFDNVFAGIDLSMFKVKNFDDDVRSIVSTSKSIYKDKSLSKEERRKLRHQTFIERIEVIESIRNNKQKRNKKKKKSNNADNSLLELPSTNVTSEYVEESVSVKRKGIPKSKDRHKCLLKDMATLRKVWQNPDFKADPTGFVSEVIQERILNETDVMSYK